MIVFTLRQCNIFPPFSPRFPPVFIVCHDDMRLLEIMHAAQRIGMTTPDFAYIYYRFLKTPQTLAPFYPLHPDTKYNEVGPVVKEMLTPEEQERSREAFMHYKQVRHLYH